MIINEIYNQTAYEYFRGSRIRLLGENETLKDFSEVPADVRADFILKSEELKALAEKRDVINKANAELARLKEKINFYIYTSRNIPEQLKTDYEAQHLIASGQVAEPASEWAYKVPTNMNLIATREDTAPKPTIGALGDYIYDGKKESR